MTVYSPPGDRSTLYTRMEKGNVPITVQLVLDEVSTLFIDFKLTSGSCKAKAQHS